MCVDLFTVDAFEMDASIKTLRRIARERFDGESASGWTSFVDRAQQSDDDLARFLRPRADAFAAAVEGLDYTWRNLRDALTRLESARYDSARAYADALLRGEDRDPPPPRPDAPPVAAHDAFEAWEDGLREEGQ